MRSPLLLLLAAALLAPLPARALDVASARADASEALDRALSWATQRLGPLPDDLGERGGRVGKEVAAILATPASVVTAAALHEAVLWGGIGLTLAVIAGRWIRARGALGCLWLLLAVPCVVLGAAWAGMWRAGGESLAAAVDEGLLLERLAVTAALAGGSGEGQPLAAGAEALAANLAATEGEAREGARQARSGLAQIADAGPGFAGAMLAPARLEAVLGALEAGTAPSPAVLLAFAAGPAALAALPDAERDAARALVARTAPVRQQALGALRATVWPNLLAGAAVALLPLLLALPVGLVARVSGGRRRRRTAISGA
ncbi:MAG TPA: hypothetical protein VMT16_05615 [Thermoanaerobaculia bacterium]|nr:hypothetical protein [Thermoanaerobaculia bacterium]